MRELYKRDQLIARLKKIAEKQRLREIGVTSAATGFTARTPSVDVSKPRRSAGTARESATGRNEPAASASISAGGSDAGSGQSDAVEPDVFDLSALDEFPPAHVVLDRWAKPDGTHDCPDGYPVKANANSRIYHVPDEPDYDKTIPEVCFTNEEQARLAGFRPRLP
jgi:hypothetical protein